MDNPITFYKKGQCHHGPGQIKANFAASQAELEEAKSGKY
jgi:hypothetical protein